MDKDRKKILFITPGFPIGGAETFLVNLINRFKNQIAPIVVSLGAGRDLIKKFDPEINVIELKRKWRYDLSIISKLRTIIEEHKIDLAFVINLFPFFFLKFAIKNINPFNIFISLHSTKPKSLKEYIQTHIYSRMLDGREVVVTVCNNQAEYISQVFKIPIEKFDTIYNGVDPSYFTLPPEDFDRNRFRDKFSIPEDSFVILQIAAFRNEKRHEDSLKALRIIHTESQFKPYLLLVGGGEEDIEQKVRKLTSQYQLSESVKFCGKQDDVRPFCWISNLFTLSSVSIETFSIAALEAMACGLPAVLTEIGGANEMIFDGINGYLVPPHAPARLAEAWVRVMKNQDTFKREKIRQVIIEKFSLDESLNKYAQLLEIG